MWQLVPLVLVCCGERSRVLLLVFARCLHRNVQLSFVNLNRHSSTLATPRFERCLKRCRNRLAPVGRLLARCDQHGVVLVIAHGTAQILGGDRLQLRPLGRAHGLQHGVGIGRRTAGARSAA